MIRPKPARWFELLVARDDATLALEALAGTAAVELEARPTAVLPAALADIRPLLRQFAEFSLRYHAYWPHDRCQASAFPEPPVATLDRSLAHIRAWAQEAEPVIQQIQRGEAEREELARWRHVLDAMAGSNVDFAQTVNAGPLVQVRLFLFPPDSEPAIPPGLLVRHFVADGWFHALAVGTAAELQPLAQQAALLKGQVRDMPAWLHTDMARNEAYVAARLSVLAGEETALRAQLAALDERHDLRTALGDAARLQWVLENVRSLETGDLFCWITGWTSELAGHRLASALDRSGARAILHYPPPPPGAAAPLLLANPWWARPFEVFSRAMGMPSRNEADPSALLAIAVPLMFGYMFADVGQGLVIAIGGFFLRKRWPLARLFVAGGLSAAVFRRPVRQRVQPACVPPAVARAARRSTDDPARPADRRRRAAGAGTAALCRRGALARRVRRLAGDRCGLRRGLRGIAHAASSGPRASWWQRSAPSGSAWATRGTPEGSLPVWARWPNWSSGRCRS